jgi:hypothetical protein
MALKPLTPGYLPLGQYDLLDSFAANFVGGEVGIFDTLATGDYYAADAGGLSLDPDVKVKGGSVAAGSPTFGVYGLVDEGTAGYGTSYGTVIGGTVGQGTGFASGVASSSASGIVVVGPRTSFGSGKATLWTMPGLYGVTSDAFVSETSTDLPTAVNEPLFGKAAGGSNAGKLTKVSASNGGTAALFINTVTDRSLVSTSAAAAGVSAAPVAEYYAVYLLGPGYRA